jgi:hypothetical protein
VGEIKVNVPEGLPLNDLRKKIIDLVKEEEEKLTSLDASKKMDKSIDAKESLQKEQRKKILDRYYGVIKLDRIVSIEEVLNLEEDSWRY